MSFRPGGGHIRPEGGGLRGMDGKTHTGMVKSYNRKGFGFIMCPGLETDLYFSRESISAHLQTADIAGEQVTFETRRFPDGRLQALNIRAVGDVETFKNSSGHSYPSQGKGAFPVKGKIEGCKGKSDAGKGKSDGGAGPPPPHHGTREEEDRSRDWYCEDCGERNFVKRFECFKCKKQKRVDPMQDGFERPGVTRLNSTPFTPFGKGKGGPAGGKSAPAGGLSRRNPSPHAGSRAFAAGRRISRSPSRRKKKSCSSSSSSSSSDAKKSKKSSRSRSRKKKKKKRDRSDSSSSVSICGVETSAAAQEPEEKNPEIEQAKAEALQKLLKLKDLEKEQRMAEWRALLRHWHPDKNPDNVAVATAVFQFLQKGKSLLDAK